MLATPLLAALATLGALNALWFLLVTYRIAPPDAKWMPRVCRMDDATCAAIVHTPEARILGLPNSALGLAYYLALLAALPLLDHPGVHAAALAASAASVALSAWLLWALRRRLRVHCPLCYLGHAVNAAMLITLAVT